MTTVTGRAGISGLRATHGRAAICDMHVRYGDVTYFGQILYRGGSLSGVDAELFYNDFIRHPRHTSHVTTISDVTCQEPHVLYQRRRGGHVPHVPSCPGTPRRLSASPRPQFTASHPLIPPMAPLISSTACVSSPVNHGTR